ncbi:MAG: ACP S-malonyltransferase [Brevinematales bacterium]
MKAYLYPGQGSQKVGMGKDLVEEFPVADEIYKKADEVLKFSLSNICFEGPEEDLTMTRNAQLAILTYSHIADVLLTMKAGKPDYTAGLSLGEYSALVAAGVLSFEDALIVIKKRGELMEGADPDGKGGMAAVLGLGDEAVKRVCAEVSREHYVTAVNFNCPGQVVISGLKEGIAMAESRLIAAGAKRVLKLSVSGAFHSELMAGAADEFSRFMKDIKINKPSCIVISNVTALPEDETNIRELLVKQLKSPVLWTDSINYLKKMNVNEAVEVGFGNSVSGLVKKIDRDMKISVWNQLI